VNPMQLGWNKAAKGLGCDNRRVTEMQKPGTSAGLSR
jgi:hypothetical protein